MTDRPASSAADPREPVPPTQVARTAEAAPLTDATAMRALAHPVRIALLEALTREGPLTATQAAEIVGESPANCSFHLRTLAKYGFIEEAEGGTGRARPWRRVSLYLQLSMHDQEADVAVAASALEEMTTRRHLEMRDHWEATRAAAPPEWQRADFLTGTIAYLTADELEALGTEVIAVLQRHVERTLDKAKRPPGAQPVSLMAYGHPIPPTATGN